MRLEQLLTQRKAIFVPNRLNHLWRGATSQLGPLAIRLAHLAESHGRLRADPRAIAQMFRCAAWTVAGGELGERWC
jgi:hypothetical protein